LSVGGARLGFGGTDRCRREPDVPLARPSRGEVMPECPEGAKGARRLGFPVRKTHAGIKRFTFGGMRSSRTPKNGGRRGEDVRSCSHRQSKGGALDEVAVRAKAVRRGAPKNATRHAVALMYARLRVEAPVTTSTIRVRVFCTGQVQGVFFRASTQEQAQALGVTGTVENLPDGAVEVTAQGSPTHVEALIAWLHRGPPRASVELIHVTSLPVDPACVTFRVVGADR
jgi:acylphosphatase